MSISENIVRVRQAIGAACERAARSEHDVTLMAVSKTQPAAALQEAYAAGIRLFGENKVQEFQQKAPALNMPGARFALIGHLQSNKAAKAVEIFDAIDSVDSLRLADRLNEAAAKLDKRLPILIEVKLSPEETKAGLDPHSPEATALFERLPDLTHLEPQGLMTIAPWGVPEDVTRACFRSLRTWRDQWATTYPRLNFESLSMGMSGDFPIAIQEGATRIRVGTALFGKRQPYTGPV